MQDDDNYFLHFNPRWNDNVLVLNSKENGSFGRQEQLQGYSFQLGTKIRIKFVVESDQCRIFQNDEYLGAFDNRMPCNLIKKVRFSWKGDATKAPTLLTLRVGYCMR